MLKSIEVTMSDKKKNLSDLDSDEFTPLMTAVLQSDFSKIKSLIAQGMNPDIESPSGDTALSLAVEDSQLEIVKLIAAIADVSYCNSHSNKAIELAHYLEEYEIFDYLALNGAIRTGRKTQRELIENNAFGEKYAG